MSAREWLAACVMVLAAAAGVGCTTGDVGTPCTLQKRNPDGGRPVFMTGSDITAEGQDIISLGAQGCEDFICVHDLGLPKPGPTDPLTGYCTHACTGSGTLQCGGVDQDPSRPYECRSLLMDEQTLSALCSPQGGNPALCDRYFGVERSSNFCARGLTDGGS